MGGDLFPDRLQNVTVVLVCGRIKEKGLTRNHIDMFLSCFPPSSANSAFHLGLNHKSCKRLLVKNLP